MCRDTAQNYFYIIFYQAFFPYLNASGYDDFDRYSEAKDGKEKKKLQKNEYIDHYMESFDNKVNFLYD